MYRAVHFETRAVAACKVVALTDETTKDERRSLQKEMKVHAILKHRNVLEFITAVVVEPDAESGYFPAVYMLLELAAGGDLFDKIGEPPFFNNTFRLFTTRFSSRRRGG